MYCNRCGSRLPEKTSICEKCGADMSRPGSPITAPPAPAPEAVDEKTSAVVKQYDDAAKPKPVPQTPHKYPMMGDKDPPPARKKKRRRWPGILCIALSVIIALYQMWVLVPYASDFMANFGLYSAMGASGDGILQLACCVLILVSCVLLVLAGFNYMRRRSARRLALASAVISTVCLLWTFNLTVFYIAEVVFAGDAVMNHWPILLYAVVLLLLCAFAWVMSFFLDRKPSPEGPKKSWF